MPSLFADGMVLQRDAEIPVWGWASPGEELSVFFHERMYRTQADSAGNWKILMQQEKAGGPFSMDVQGESSRHVIDDIYVGDVWLCSGQSNMEFWMDRIKSKYADEIANSENPNIRQFKVEKDYDFQSPHTDVNSEGWKKATPSNVFGFSAVAWFFAKSLYEKYEVPIGLILSSWGGTPVEAWMSRDALADFPSHLATAEKWMDDSLLSETIRKDQQVRDRWYAESVEKDQGLADKNLPWYSQQVEFKNWTKQNFPGYWEKADEDFSGVIWLKKEFELSTDQSSQSAFLSLGCIVGINECYLNGVKIGTTYGHYVPSEYQVPQGLLQAGRNIITLRITDNGRRGGLIPDKPYYMAIDGDTLTMAGEWLEKIGTSLPSLAWGTDFSDVPTGLYNAMIAPLLPYRIKGTIWYQGESNSGNAEEYRTTFPTMIQDWRKKWGQGDFPFLFVQLASYLATKDQPEQSNWAELREAQAMTLALPNTGMACAIDIGEWNDVHPKNKKDVGKRLALAAQKVAYGETELVASGPQFQSMEIKGKRVLLNFNLFGSQLVCSGKELNGFAIAGKDGQFKRAKAEIKGSQVVVWNDEIKNPVAVRYAWADNPDTANLFNPEGLPAIPFRTDK
ncbi:sialate O-acetylesterase [Mangrovibacterium diazotrophicum]|nr:sialate O-acetylesterase [Mangrovibacterium diazotrophicum]